MKISELISQLTEIKNTHGDLPMARSVEYDESDPEEGYADNYTYSFSHPVVVPVVEQNYGQGYVELIDVTGEESIHDTVTVVVLG